MIHQRLLLFLLWIPSTSGFLSPLASPSRRTNQLHAKPNKKKEGQPSRKRDRLFGGFFSEESKKEPETESSGPFALFRRNRLENDDKNKASGDGKGPLAFLRQRDKRPQEPKKEEGRSLFGGFTGAPPPSKELPEQSTSVFGAAFGAGGNDDKQKRDGGEVSTETLGFRGFGGPKKEDSINQAVSPKESQAPRSMFEAFGSRDERENEAEPSKTRSIFSGSPSPKDVKQKRTRKAKDKDPRVSRSEPKKSKEKKDAKSAAGNNVFSMMIDKWKAREKENWIQVFPKTRIMPGESVPVTVGGIDLLVVASLDGRSLYCIANSCPHLGTPLETGVLTRLPKEVSAKSDAELSKLVLSETTVSDLLSQDGCEDCIVCPLHKTAFALKSGEVRGEWCPYPPVLGSMVGAIKKKTAAAVFEVRTRGKFVEVRLNTLLEEPVEKS